MSDSSDEIDSVTILSMPEQDLREWVPKYGDRVLSFCRRNADGRKKSLIEKLKLRMEEKQNKGNTSRVNQTQKIRKTKSTRIVEIGWLCKNDNDTCYHQVRTKYGGGTRKISVNKMFNCNDILEKGTNLFFHEGVSTKGNIEMFDVELLDYKHHKCKLHLTVQEMYDISALSTLRFYLATCKKEKSTNENEDIPETFEQTSNSVSVLEDINLDNILPNDLTEYGTGNIAYSSTFTVTDNGTTHDLTSNIIHETNMETIELLRFHRGNIFEEFLKVFENTTGPRYFKIQMVLPNGQIEAGDDLGGVLRDVLSEFWSVFYEKCTVGTSFKIPYLRHDFGEVQWKSVAKIFIYGYEVEKYIPIKIAPSFLKQCFGLVAEQQEILENFLCDTERDLIKNA
ncbi:hypothetical protein FQR65_LT09646 [Abscondita terminalis]|nr:hypothetical protein FQR65_LT09646 [Abscondita terminalis]